MRTPTYDYLGRLSEEGMSIIYASGPLAPSGNPRYFKYFWQLFSMESPLEGGEFLLNAPALCTGSRNLTRPPRQRGGVSRRRGINREHDCLLVARDRIGKIGRAHV